MTELNQFTHFTYELLIRENHVDTLGHVNNATYLQLCEEARWEFITQRGFGLVEIQQRQQGPVILECKLKFLKEIKLRERIKIETQTLHYKDKIGVLRQVIFKEQGDISCEVEMSFGLFDTSRRKLILPTAEWLYAIGGSAVPL